MKTVNKKGFTLIEVVLVLAIGGLIFLLAFLAFQQVSRNRRDTQRRSDAARMATVYNDLKANDPNATITESSWSTAILALPNIDSPSGGSYTYESTFTTTPDEDDFTLQLAPTPRVCLGLESGAVCRTSE